MLAKTKPDLVVACYGMNDGIYSPFSEGRFAKYREGIESLRRRASASGAKVLHVTPPVFDPAPIKANTLPAGLAEYRKPFEGYDDVLTRYSEWLLSRRADGWDVVDAHGPMKAFLERQRALKPAFRLANDGVHVDALGHWAIARAILTHWGVPAGELGDDPRRAFEGQAELLVLVREKQSILKAAWLTETGHKRPGDGPRAPAGAGQPQGGWDRSRDPPAARRQALNRESRRGSRVLSPTNRGRLCILAASALWSLGGVLAKEIGLGGEALGSGGACSRP